MKSKLKKITYLFISLLMALLLNNTLIFNNGVQTELSVPKQSAVHEPIFIDGAATGVGAHNWTWAEKQSWCSGDGSWGNPYIIENLKINGTGTEKGIDIVRSDVSFIIQDCLINNTDTGIYLQDVNNARLINNTCSNLRLGLDIDTCNNNTISGNTVNGNTGEGIFLYECNNNTISGNTANDNNFGIYLNYCNYNNITENTANDNGESGIYIEYSSNNTLSGSSVNNNGDSGIVIDTDSNNNTISGNTANGNIYNGIYLASSDNNTIQGNTANDNGEYGIYLYFSDHNTVLGNTANYNDVFIFIDNSHYNNITGNTANGNNYEGISLGDGSNNTIKGNKISNNDYGIYIETGDYNDIIDNIFYNNTLGMYIESGCDNNSIYQNFFLENGKHAEDDGTDNSWNSTSIGNYWDNHTGPDVNDDGIVDAPYNISRSPLIQDYLPIAEDGAPSITINSPSSSDVFGATAPSFDVTITDDHLDEMWYTLDGGSHNYTFIENEIINQAAWDAMLEGSITLTFYASDIPRNIASEVVIITKDFEVPVVQITSPTQGNVFGVSAPSFDVTITDDYLDSMWYTLDGGLHNYTFTVNGSIEQPAWNAVSDGAVILKFYANDTLGHVGSAEVSVVKDTTAPIIVINSPTDGEEFGTQAPLFNITVTDDHLDSIWYSFDGGVTTFAITDNTVFNQTVWTALLEGDVTITFYANDTLGHEASEAVTVVKSIPSGGVDPTIIIVIVVVSIAGGVAVAAVIYIYLKKRASPE